MASEDIICIPDSHAPKIMCGGDVLERLHEVKESLVGL